MNRNTRPPKKLISLTTFKKLNEFLSLLTSKMINEWNLRKLP